MTEQLEGVSFYSVLDAVSDHDGGWNVPYVRAMRCPVCGLGGQWPVASQQGRTTEALMVVIPFICQSGHRWSLCFAFMLTDQDTVAWINVIDHQGEA